MTAAYARPASVAEAADLLAAGGWAVLAGGTDLYAANVGREPSAPLLDLTGIAALRGIELGADGWRVGATTTWTDVRRAALPPLFAALQQSAAEIGGLQVQNAGTVAGNLCNASPAADGTPVWLALDARVELQRRGGRRELPVADFVRGSRRTALEAHEFVTGLHVPARSPRARSVFAKLGGRRYLTISITMVAVLIDVDALGRIDHAAVAVGSCAARAQRLGALEARLVGLPLAALAGVRIAPDDLGALTPIDDLRGSAAYRRDATTTLLRRAFAGLAAA